MDVKEYKKKHKQRSQAREFLSYIGPGLLITVGFIDPGNWASNLAAGADYGYLLLWMVTLSTIMLIFLQHNAARLGIATGLCLAEAANQYLPKWISLPTLLSAVLASIATALAEILGGAIALNLLFNVPLWLGSILMAALCSWLLRSNSYRKLEKIIIAFVSLIGLSFLLEIIMVPLDLSASVKGWVTPSIPSGSLLVIMSVLGAVVMPHNLFLHSEVIQSRQWNLLDEKLIKKQFRFEFLDTVFSMTIGWAINSAMILVAAAVFYANQVQVSDLSQAVELLRPLLGNNAAILFAVALLFAGISSTVTAGMAGASIYAGMFGEGYDVEDPHSWHGILLTYWLAVLVILFIEDPFTGLIYSQMALSVQLPWTIGTLIYLTSSKKVMGKFVNSTSLMISLSIIGAIVIVLNIMLLLEAFGIMQF